MTAFHLLNVSKYNGLTVQASRGCPLRCEFCAEVLIGLESPTEAGLAGLELKVDWKRKHWPHYKQAIRRIQSHGTLFQGKMTCHRRDSFRMGPS